MVGWLGYFGMMAGPPVVGFSAEVIGLPAALGIVCGMVLAVALLAGYARPEPPPPPPAAPRAVAAC